MSCTAYTGMTCGIPKIKAADTTKYANLYSLLRAALRARAHMAHAHAANAKITILVPAYANALFSQIKKELRVALCQFKPFRAANN
jgi:hypothetical protein